jgi:hypothetical protein
VLAPLSVPFFCGCSPPSVGQIALHAKPVLSTGEIEKLRAKVTSAWNPPKAAGANPAQYVVKIRMRLAIDGRLNAPPEVLTQGEDPIFQATRDSAVRAVVQSQPYDMLSPSTYEAWKVVEINFDPREAKMSH